MEVRFINDLYVMEIDDSRWKLIANFMADVIDISEHRIIVPIGFETDFASVPRFPIAYALYGNRAHKPAVLHDYLYSLGGTEADREYADQVLRAAIITDCKDKALANNMYIGVRTFGGSHWGK